jgi:hypothetical protein
MSPQVLDQQNEMQPPGKAPSSESIVLVRYGAVPEVARCQLAGIEPVARGTQVVLQTARGEQLGVVLEPLKRRQEPRPAHLAATPVEEAYSFEVLRIATSEDLARAEESRAVLESEFPHWERRIAEWELDLQLVELEVTLDGNRILYVLNERGPDCTKLALRAAAAGLGIVSVQPVGAEGPVVLPASAGVGSGSCGSSGGSCGCH